MACCPGNTTPTVNPCACVGTTITPPCPTTCSSSTNCIRPVHVNISCVNSVPPAGVGTYDISTDSISTVCGSVTYQIVSFDTDHFSSVTISAGGVITFTLSADAVPGTYGEIVYMISCNDKPLAALGTVLVCAENICLTVICPEGEECVSTTGLCTPSIPDLEIE